MLAVAGPAVMGHAALATAITAAVVSMSAARRRPALARRAATASAAAAGAAVVVLARALVGRDYRLAYVAEVVARPASRPYRLAGLWAAMGGSLLLYAAMASAAVAVAARRVHRRHHELLGPFLRAASVVPAWLLALVWWGTDPFRLLAQPAIDGRGLTPILEHPAMLVHPPLLYAGTVLAVPLAALAVVSRSHPIAGGPIAGRPGVGGPGAVTATFVWWALAGLVVLTAAIGLGARWAYVEVGWGGFWAWDPVENGGLLVWLAFVAVVHAQRRPLVAARAAIGALAAAMAGAVLTRSGAASSVHAFGEATRVGYGLAALAGLLLAAVLVATWAPRPRRPAFAGRSGTPVALGVQRTDGSAAPVDGPAGDERQARGWAARLAGAQVVLVSATAAVIALGTAWPVVAGWVDGRRRALDPRFFTASVAPLAAVACAGSLSALVVAWRARRGPDVASGARRCAMVLAHLGFVVLVVASCASSFGTDRTVPMRPGRPVTVAGVTLTADRPTALERQGYRLAEAPIEVRGRGAAVTLRPALRVYEAAGAVLPETARRSGWLLDTQLALRRFDDAGGVVLDVHVRPAVRWVWVGALLIFAGFAVAAAAGAGSHRRPPAPAAVAEPEAAAGPMSKPVG